LVGQAVGDALGQSYEFGKALAPSAVVSMKAGPIFGLGEWTDDTDQAIASARAGKDFGFSSDEALQSAAVQFMDWRKNAKDIGIQTRSVFERIGQGKGDPEELFREMMQSTRDYAFETERHHGNGSLMRTSPIALGFLDGRAGLLQAAKGFSELTHSADDCWQACYIWSEAIRGAVLNGNYDGLWAGIDQLDPASRELWRERMTKAETLDPYSLYPNGYVVSAIQLAWAAIAQTSSEGPNQFRAAVELCIRVGDDTDTTAAICGSLVGARWGDSKIPSEWSDVVHGWPGFDVADLRKLATDLAHSSFGN
jgi:ADP-ribosylglycohydrolase